MSIRYNTNSTLIPKFQRNDLIRPDRKESKSYDGFQSQYDKDSDDYLKELCCTHWTSLKLHGRINKFDKLELSINAFCALLVGNFLSWYGAKIPTEDDQFPNLVFDLIQNAISHSRKCEIDLEDWICDQLALILSQHFQVMTELIRSKKATFSNYCRLTLYRNQYPQLITEKLKSPLNNQSELQSTFFAAVLNDLLFGKVLDGILEPYYLLQALRKLPAHQEQASVTQDTTWSLVTCLKSILSVRSFIAKLFAILQRKSDQQQRPFLYRHVFILLFQQIFRIHDKKPCLFVLFKSLQFWTFNFKPMDHFLHNAFASVLTTRIMAASLWENTFITLRHLIFPQDMEMGTANEIPTGKALETIKIEACDKLWEFIRHKHLDLLFGITHEDVHLWIRILSMDKKCNKLLFFRVIDCFLANLEFH